MWKTLFFKLSIVTLNMFRVCIGLFKCHPLLYGGGAGHPAHVWPPRRGPPNGSLRNTCSAQEEVNCEIGHTDSTGI